MVRALSAETRLRKWRRWRLHAQAKTAVAAASSALAAQLKLCLRFRGIEGRKQAKMVGAFARERYEQYVDLS